jgi:hypothetical protein
LLLDSRPNASCVYETKLMSFISKSLLQTTAVVSLLFVLPSASSQTLPTALNLVVIEGEGATNNIRQRLARDPVVQVEDENHKPVAGAIVIFTLPTEGATGDFNGHKSLTIATDNKGQAVGKGLKLNPVPGKVPIHVTASYRGLAVRTIINQVSVVPPGEKAGTSSSGGHHGALIGILVAVAAAGGAGAYLATRKSSTAATIPTAPTGPAAIGITPGTGSIGGGH